MHSNVIDKIRDLAEAAATPKVITLDGREFSNVPLAPPPELPQEKAPPIIGLTTLTGLVDWWGAESERMPDAKDGLLVHVRSPHGVAVLGPPRGFHQQRFTYAITQATDLCDGWLNTFHPQEEFVIGLMTRFLDVPADDRATVLKFIGNLTQEAVRTQIDDGVSQVVTARQGIGTLANVTLPNLVSLTPRRTFVEIGGIAELFVLRVREGAKVALFSADAGSWKLDAIAGVASWLREKLPAGTQVIA